MKEAISSIHQQNQPDSLHQTFATSFKKIFFLNKGVFVVIITNP